MGEFREISIGERGVLDSGVNCGMQCDDDAVSQGVVEASKDPIRASQTRHQWTKAFLPLRQHF